MAATAATHVNDPAEGLLALRASSPTVSLAEAEDIARSLFGLAGEVTSLAGELDRNFRVRSGQQDVVLKISAANQDPANLDLVTAALRHVAATAPELPVPRVIATLAGTSLAPVSLPGRTGLSARALSFLSGRPLEYAAAPAAVLRPAGALIAKLDRALRGFHHPAAGGKRLVWDLREAARSQSLLTIIEAPETRQLAMSVFDRFRQRTLPGLARLRAQVIHNDAHGSNIVVDPANPAQPTGLLDFGDLLHGPLLFELVIPLADIVIAGLPTIETAEELVAGYAAELPLEDDEVGALYDCVVARQALTLGIFSWRRQNDPAGSALIADFETISRDGLHALVSLGRDTVTRRLARAAGHHTVVGGAEPDATPAIADTRARRSRVLGAGLELSYEEPLHIVRGEDVWLIAADGRRFLDCYNNVPHVGHSHPAVVEAVSRQWRVLNTNTRYLSEPILDYAERLLATLPPGTGLDRCLFVNNGSEANDIAWRMATLVTGARGGITMDNAYHGGTEAVAALSPYDHMRFKLQPHIRALEAPDTYRGRFGAERPTAGADYAADAERATASLEQAGLGTAAFIVDTGFISSGMLDAPAGYLARVAACIRRAGGLVIADEVQFGFGRSGNCFWGFATHGITPDFVTIGKPAGNGQPMGIVITRADILERFFQATSYFSTFGGNQVTAAAGLAVLDVLARQRLQENARTVGTTLKAGLAALQQRHRRIGDVRGQGLKLGVEIVGDRATRTPDRVAAKAVANGVRQRGCLIGTEGPEGNVLKIRPPMTFSAAHAELLLAALDASFTALG